MQVETRSAAFLGIRKVESQKSQDFYIKNLDPLNIDSIIDKIPLLNKGADTKGLINFLYSIIPFPDEIKKYNYVQAAAAMRDIGIFLGSIKRHGIEPVEAIPELDYILDELSHKTDLPPRDTLLHYTIWNPEGDRLRTYTGTKDEVELINSVKISTYPLMDAIYHLIKLHHTDMEDPEFEEICSQAECSFKEVVEGIVHSKRNVSPEVFAKELRFYFDPIFIHNKEVIGPGAVEMPMFIFDHLLWSSDTENVPYAKFKIGFLPYILPNLRDVYYDFDNKSSLVTKAINNIYNAGNITQMVTSAKALLKLCKLLKSFRMPHRKMAEEAYSYEQKHKRNKGSGGYSTAVLNDIIELNLKQINRLSEALNVVNLNYIWR